jgi:iron complex transport system ATP-binding protein
MTRNNPPILSAKNLAIGYKKKAVNLQISKDLDLELFTGELVCLLGKNGIGKSTLLRTLIGVQPALAGEIKLKEILLQHISRQLLAQNISVVLTEKPEVSNLTVYELVALSRHPYTNWLGKLQEEDKKEIGLALMQTDLSDLRDKKVDELSDGQIQRVMICRALAQNTELIILDEPTTHLDIEHKIETFHLLKKLASELNKCILISTHEIQLGLQTADVIWLMNEKGIISGSPQELIENDQIGHLFDNTLIYFDKKNLQFLISNEQVNGIQY